MQDFSQKHRGNVVHFGMWSDEIADDLGMADALLVLQKAAKQTFETDVRSEALSSAIAYLTQHTPRTRPLKDFEAALNIADPVQRYYAVRHALVRVKVATGFAGK